MELKRIMEDCKTYYIDFDEIENDVKRRFVTEPTIDQLRELVSKGLLINKNKRPNRRKTEDELKIDEELASKVSEKENLLRLWSNKRNCIVLKYNGLLSKFKQGDGGMNAGRRKIEDNQKDNDNKLQKIEKEIEPSPNEIVEKMASEMFRQYKSLQKEYDEKKKVLMKDSSTQTEEVKVSFVTTMVVGNSSSRITSPAFETPLW